MHARVHTHIQFTKPKRSRLLSTVLVVSLNVRQNVGEDVLYGRIHCMTRHCCIQFHKIHHPSLLVYQLPRVTPWNIFIQKLFAAGFQVLR